MGQLGLVAPGTLVHRLLHSRLPQGPGGSSGAAATPGQGVGYLPSLILWGPTGSGKTTVARMIGRHAAAHLGYRYVEMSACDSGLAQVRELVEAARNLWRLRKTRTLLMLDEIHRFNRLQQDVFLPHLESGLLALIGATTENPSFSCNAALLSRCRVLTLDRLGEPELLRVLRRGVSQLLGELDPAPAGGSGNGGATGGALNKR